MACLRTDGIIIKAVNIGEADRIVTIFTRDHGKVKASARGARRPRSRIVAGSQFLCYGRFILYKGKNLYSVNSCDVIESFYGIRNDLVKLTYASHMVELLNDVVQEDLPAPSTLRLFLNTLHMLVNTGKQPELVTRIFELRMMSLMGFTPEIYGCIECGGSFEDGGSFDFERDGIICAGCQGSKSGLYLDKSAIKAMQHIIYSPMEKLFRFALASQSLSGLSRLMERYLEQKLEKNFKKLDYLKNIGC